MSTHNAPFLNIKKKIILNYPKYATMGFVPRDPRTSSKQLSVFEPLKFYCILHFRCNCPVKFRGTLCEQPYIPCYPDPCQNTGLCKTTGETTYQCICPAGMSFNFMVNDIKFCKSHSSEKKKKKKKKTWKISFSYTSSCREKHGFSRSI